MVVVELLIPAWAERAAAAHGHEAPLAVAGDRALVVACTLTGEPLLLTGLVMTALVLVDLPSAERDASGRRPPSPG